MKTSGTKIDGDGETIIKWVMKTYCAGAAVEFTFVPKVLMQRDEAH